MQRGSGSGFERFTALRCKHFAKKQSYGNQTPGKGRHQPLQPDSAFGMPVRTAVQISPPSGLNEAHEVFANDEVIQETGCFQFCGDVPG